MNTIAHHIQHILRLMGEDPTREGLAKTPERVQRSLGFLTSGYQQRIEDIITDAVFHSDVNEMIIVKDIELFSLCEHHLLPFIGKCHVAYLPAGNVLGLSRIARIVDMYARRLQVQENLTQEIANAIMQATHAKGAAVIIEAKHLCMVMRGGQKQNADLVTSVMLGLFRDKPETRLEFLNLINK